MKEERLAILRMLEKGNISVENKEFTYYFNSYTGACFSIILDRKNL